MKAASPYQPLILRILHGVIAIVGIGAIVSAFWVYNTYDGRIIKISLPKIEDIIGIHGTLGLTFLLLLPIFALYSFHFGQKRLIQPDSIQKLSQIPKPIGFYNLHRIVNTLMLLAATWAVITGRRVKEEWFAAGELEHIWYYLHLVAWLILVSGLLFHLVMGLKVGGLALITSMFSRQIEASDSPRLWKEKIYQLWVNRRR